jgi:hypothetical protein
MRGNKLRDYLMKPDHLRDETFEFERVALDTSQEPRFVEPDTLLACINDNVYDTHPCVLREVDTGVKDIRRYEVMQQGVRLPRATVEIKSWADDAGEHESIYLHVERRFGGASGLVEKFEPGHTIAMAVTKNGHYSFKRDDHAFERSGTVFPSRFLLNPETRSELHRDNISYRCN